MLLICYAVLAPRTPHHVRPAMSHSGPLPPSCGKSGLPCRRGASLSKKRCKGVQKSTLTPRVTPLILMTVCHLALKKLKKSDFGVHRLSESPNGFPKVTSGSQIAPQKDPLASTMPPKMASKQPRRPSRVKIFTVWVTGPG